MFSHSTCITGTSVDHGSDVNIRKAKGQTSSIGKDKKCECEKIIVKLIPFFYYYQLFVHVHIKTITFIFKSV